MFLPCRPILYYTSFFRLQICLQFCSPLFELLKPLLVSKDLYIYFLIHWVFFKDLSVSMTVMDSNFFVSDLFFLLIIDQTLAALPKEHIEFFNIMWLLLKVQLFIRSLMSNLELGLKILDYSIIATHYQLIFYFTYFQIKRLISNFALYFVILIYQPVISALRKLCISPNCIIRNMRPIKKSNNYFEKPILHQSLFHEEVTKEYLVGGKKIKSGWLRDQPPMVYRANIKSAFELSEHKEQYDLLREKSKNQTVDMFRLAELKDKIDNFERMELSPKKQRHWEKIKVEENNLKVQKIADLWGSFERNAKIADNTLYIESVKEKKEKPIDILPYTLTIDDKGKPLKQASKFQWLEKYNIRLFLHGEKLREYCIYGEEKSLREIARGINLQKMEKKDLGFLKELEKKFEQKVYIQLGNKLRIYEKHYRELEKKHINKAYDMLNTSGLLTPLSKPKDTVKSSNQSQEMVPNDLKIPEASKFFKSDSFHDSDIKTITENSNDRKESVPGSPLRKQSGISDSMFRMKTRRSTIFYDQLDNYEEPREMQDYKVSDINLHMKEVSLSDEELEGKKSSEGERNEEEKCSEDHHKTPMSSFKNIKEVPIFELNEEDSQSQLDIEKSDNNRKEKNSRIKQPSFYEIIEDPEDTKTHFLRIGYFEQFLPFSNKQIKLILVQKRDAFVEYADMKLPVCCMSEFTLVRDEKSSRFYPQGELSLEITSRWKEFSIFLDEEVRDMRRQDFSVNLSKVFYPVDASQLIYIKNNSKAIKLCGKLKVMCSNSPISDGLMREISTMEFLEDYIFGDVPRKKVYDFIECKKRHHQICCEFRERIMRRIIKSTDNREFEKAIFYGIPEQIYQGLLKIASTKFENIEGLKMRKMGSKTFLNSTMKSIMENICLKRVYDVRVFMSVNNLIDLIVQTEKNQCLEERLQKICEYYRLKLGQAGYEKILAAFVLQVCSKLEPLLIKLKKLEEVGLVIREYFELEYEIDQLFQEIGSYFN